jgi:hypothetical protein
MKRGAGHDDDEGEQHGEVKHHRHHGAPLHAGLDGGGPKEDTVRGRARSSA